MCKLNAVCVDTYDTLSLAKPLLSLVTPPSVCVLCTKHGKQRTWQLLSELIHRSYSYIIIPSTFSYVGWELWLGIVCKCQWEPFSDTGFGGLTRLSMDGIVIAQIMIVLDPTQCCYC